MISDAVLTRRAIRQCLDDHGLEPDSIRLMPAAQRSAFEDLVEATRDHMRYDQLRWFRPFDHQRRFFETTTDRRGILAANRIGKTVSTCYETAMHLTGEYPAWWQGRRFTQPVQVMVAGEGWSQVALVLQNELLGTQDIKLVDNIGTGAIPRRCIRLDTLRSDGANAIGVEIAHSSGGASYLLFANYTQEVRQLQGLKLDIAVFDEQPPDDFFSEVVTRTATTQGMVMCSFTPLKGLNGLVSKFWNREEGYDFVRVSWEDVPEYDPWGEPFLLMETRRQLERDYLPHEREARIAGRPIMGKGAIFQLRDWPTYGREDFRLEPHTGLERVIALDLGLVNDRTVITLMLWDPRAREAWLHRQITVRGTDEANPTNYITHLLRPEVLGCPIVLPPDAVTPGRYTMTSASLRELFEESGLNVVPEPIHNPPDAQGRTTNHKAYGVNIMRQMLEAGTLHVNENCQEFLREAQNYYVDDRGRFSDPDDTIDSARYALLACLLGWSEPWDGTTRQQRMAQARAVLQRPRVDPNTPTWKRTYTTQ